MVGGVPHQGGLPGRPVQVTRFGGVSFLHAKAAEWGNPPNRGNQITRAWQVISTISRPKSPNAEDVFPDMSIQSLTTLLEYSE